MAINMEPYNYRATLLQRSCVTVRKLCVEVFEIQ